MNERKEKVTGYAEGEEKANKTEYKLRRRVSTRAFTYLWVHRLEEQQFLTRTYANNFVNLVSFSYRFSDCGNNGFIITTPGHPLIEAR